MRRALNSSLGRRYGLAPSTYTEGMPIVRSLQHILRLGPTVLLPMYGALVTKWKGTPIYYDAPTGEPVDQIGDPVGGVLDLAGGEIKATQGTDSRRPLLTATGLQYSGSDVLELSDDWENLRTEDWTHYVDATRTTTNFTAVLSWSESSNPIEYQWSADTDRSSSGTTGWAGRVGSGAVDNIPDAWPNGERIVFGASNSSSAGEWTARVDGDTVTASHGTHDTPTTTPWLGARDRGDGGIEVGHEGEIRAAVLFDGQTHGDTKMADVLEVLR